MHRAELTANAGLTLPAEACKYRDCSVGNYQPQDARGIRECSVEKGSRIPKHPIPAIWWGLLVCVLLGVAAAHPIILSGRLPLGSDTVFHLERIIEFDTLLHSGVIIPRWAPDFVNGYGYPLFIFYAPFSYVLPETLHLIGLPFVSSFLAALVLVFICAAAAMYLWSRDLLGEVPALVAAAAYVFSPYMLANLLRRTVLPELTALALLPLVLYALRRLITTTRIRYYVLLTGTTGLLILTHNVTALLFIPIAFGYLVLLLINNLTARPRVLLYRTAAWAVVAILLGIGLAAYFWLPALAEAQQVQLDRLVLGDSFSYSNHFNTLSQLFPVSLLADNYLIERPSWSCLSLTAAASGLVGSALWWRLEQRRSLVVHSVFALAVLGLSIWLVNPSSAWLWKAIPQMQLLQFPWRFVGLATMSLAWLCGLGAAVTCGLLRGKWKRLTSWIAAVLVALLFVGGIPWQWVPQWLDPMPHVSRVDINTLDIRYSSLGSTTMGEYLPATVQQLPPLDASATAEPYDRLDRSSLPPGYTIQHATWEPLAMSVDLSLPSTSSVVFKTFYYAGWRAWVDGVEVTITPTLSNSLISLSVPSGGHQIQVLFGSTAIRDLGLGISLAALLLLVGSAWWFTHLKRPGAQVVSSAPKSTRPSVWPILLVLAVAIGAKFVLIDLPSTAYDGVRNDTAQAIRFGGALEFAGARETTAVPSGGIAPVILYWRAPVQLDANYSTGVYAVDERGIDAAWQHSDHQHPAGVPTRAWYPGDIFIDGNVLHVPAGTPPGKYTLRVVVYPYGGPDDTLDIVDQTAGVHGKALDAVDIQVKRPSQPASIEELAPPLRIERPLGADLQLLGSSPLPERVSAGDSFLLQLYWQVLQTPGKTLTIGLQFVDPQGRIASSVSVAPVPTFGTEQWQAGDAWRGIHLLRSVPSLAGPYTLTVSLDGAEPISLGSVYVTAPAHIMAAPDAEHQQQARFDDLALLTGYNAASSAKPDQTLTVTLVWRVQSETDRGYKVFVHLLDSSGRAVASHDAEPANWQRATTSWMTGEYIIDAHPLEIPADLAAGSYRLEIGIYDTSTGERLSTDVGADAVILDQMVEIAP